ncbi:MAG: SDR family NAD(P)-dependent oxidoreductase [Cyclobacteriaceae bacterium]
MESKEEIIGKKILITGGAGYLGSYLTKQFSSNGAKVIVYSRDELKHFNLKMQLGDLASNVEFVIGDVRDRERLIEATKSVDIIIHAAALKQVSTCEHNPKECYKTNVTGTENVIAASQTNGVAKLVFISSDKAVEPVSVYGNSKQAGEKLVLNANEENLSTSIIRLGNLIGSPGSIADKVLKLNDGDELKIYSPKLTRFTNSLEAAYSLIEALVQKDLGGCIMLPKLRSVRILDFVKEQFPMLKLALGGQPSYEKTHEKLATSSELERSVVNGQYYLILPEAVNVDVGLDEFGCLPSVIKTYSSDEVFTESSSNSERNFSFRLETE